MTERMPDGGWSTNDKGWVLHPSQQERNRAVTAESLAIIAMRQEHAPRCALCGQRALALDRYGLCSKITDSHRQWRTEVGADIRKGTHA